MRESEETSGPVDVANYGSLAVQQFAPHVARRRLRNIWGGSASLRAEFMDFTADFNVFSVLTFNDLVVRFASSHTLKTPQLCKVTPVSGEDGSRVPTG